MFASALPRLAEIWQIEGCPLTSASRAWQAYLDSLVQVLPLTRTVQNRLISELARLLRDIDRLGWGAVAA